MTFGTLVALAFAIWLFCCGASLLATYWNVAAGSQRLRAAFISSGVALLIGWLGMSRIQLAGSKTVNGHVAWSINSRWFFVGAVILAAASLALTFWNWSKASGRQATAT